MERKFTHIVFPASLWLSKEYTLVEKALIVEINSLDATERRCYASNKQLAFFCNVNVQTIANYISRLQRRGIIHATYRDKGKTKRESMYVDGHFLESYGLDSKGGYSYEETPKDGGYSGEYVRLTLESKSGVTPQSNRYNNNDSIDDSIDTNTLSRGRKRKRLAGKVIIQMDKEEVKLLVDTLYQRYPRKTSARVDKPHIERAIKEYSKEKDCSFQIAFLHINNQLTTLLKQWEGYPDLEYFPGVYKFFNGGYENPEHWQPRKPKGKKQETLNFNDWL